jgi:hypothetical protein
LGSEWNRSVNLGPVRPNRTRPDETRFCRIFASLTSKNEPAGFRPDRTGQILNPAGPDRRVKIRPVPTLNGIFPSKHSVLIISPFAFPFPFHLFPSLSDVGQSELKTKSPCGVMKRK